MLDFVTMVVAKAVVIVGLVASLVGITILLTLYPRSEGEGWRIGGITALVLGLSIAALGAPLLILPRHTLLSLIEAGQLVGSAVGGWIGAVLVYSLIALGGPLILYIVFLLVSWVFERRKGRYPFPTDGGYHS